MNRYSLIQRHQFPNFRVHESASHRIRTTGSARVPSSLWKDSHASQILENIYHLVEENYIRNDEET